MPTMNLTRMPFPSGFSKTMTCALALLGLGWNLDTALAQELPVDLAPPTAEPAGTPVPREPHCQLGKDTITLYMNPFKLDGFNNETGRKFGKPWNFVDSSGKNAVHINSLTPCFYLPEVQNWLVSTTRRVLEETGADGIRLDEVAYQYGACFAPDHEHVAFEERGLSEWNKAMAETVRRASDLS